MNYINLPKNISFAVYGKHKDRAYIVATIKTPQSIKWLWGERAARPYVTKTQITLPIHTKEDKT